jgi:ABC-type Mn2+/Zn2+ transport system permease subunit
MGFLEPLIEPWRNGIDQRALVEIVIVAAVGGGLGYWITTVRLTYSAESLAHSLLPGLVAAALIGVPLLAGAAVGVVAAALLIALAGRDERVGPDTATAVVVTALVGLGSALALAPTVPPRLSELLFGDLLGVTTGDLVAAGVLAVVAAALLYALHRPLVAVVFDRAGAAAAGIRPALVLAALIVLLAATVTVGVQGLGNLLVLAVIAGPPVAVRRHVRTPGSAVIAGALVGAVAGAAGLYASYYLDIAAGGAVALSLCAFAAIGAALPSVAVSRRSPARAPAAAG